MDSLNKLITALREQNKVLSIARFNYLSKEAEKRHYEAKLITEAIGKSHAEKVTLAQSSDDWVVFHRELAKLESRYQFELFKYQILDKEFQAEYLTRKQDGEEMKKSGAEDERRNDYRPL